MQQMIPSEDSSSNHFLVPLPPGISESSSELFGFFVYEICVNLEIQWSTAQARFGRSVRLSGVKHPAPSLICSVARDNNGITVSGPHATRCIREKILVCLLPPSYGRCYMRRLSS